MKIIKTSLIVLVLVYIISCGLIACIPKHSVTFINETCIIPYKNYDYHICQPIHVNIDGTIYVIPKGFTTDLASIPKPLWSFIAPQYTGFVAPAVLHDYLYSCSNLFNRKLDDEILYSALRSNGVGRFIASKFYFAVRIFGEKHYAEHNDICTRISL